MKQKIRDKKNHEVPAFTISRPRLCHVACAVTLLPAIGLAAPWQLGANIDLGVIHTDNLFLAADGLEEGDNVYLIRPEIYLTTDGERTQANMRYRPEAYFYQEFEDADTVYHVVDATLTTALVREKLFVYLSGVNYQSIVTPEAQLPTSNIPLTGNRVDSRIFEVRPYWQDRIGRADLLLEAGYRDLYYDDEQFQSSDEKFGNFSLDNYAQQSGIAWGLSYDYLRAEYEESIPFEFQRAQLSLGYWVSGALRLFVAGGAESSLEDLLESNMDEEFWEAGFQYTPNQRLNLELAGGERSYGTSVRGNLSYTLRRGTLSFDYSETPTSRSDTIWDSRPILDDDDLDNILNQPGNADRFIRKRGEFRIAIELNKSELTLRAFSEKREDRVAPDGTPQPDEDYAGLAGDWEWRFGARTSLEVSADIARRDDGLSNDKLRRYGLGLAYQLTSRTSLRIEGQHSSQQGIDSSDFDYTENQGRFLIRVELP